MDVQGLRFRRPAHQDARYSLVVKPLRGDLAIDQHGIPAGREVHQRLPAVLEFVLARDRGGGNPGGSEDRGQGFDVVQVNGEQDGAAVAGVLEVGVGKGLVADRRC